MDTYQDFPRITPFLWFDSNAEEAVDFYLGIFKNSRKLGELRRVDDSHGPIGGPHFKFTEAVSFAVRCDSQQELDEYWSKLTAGGAESQCGWLKDKFGLSWQIVPARLPELVKNPKAMQALMKMVKLDIAELERAAQL